jgi:hypothetical protein
MFATTDAMSSPSHTIHSAMMDTKCSTSHIALSALSVECQVSNHKPVWRGRGAEWMIPFVGAVLSKRLGACADLHVSQLHLA